MLDPSGAAGGAAGVRLCSEEAVAPPGRGGRRGGRFEGSARSRAGCRGVVRRLGEETWSALTPFLVGVDGSAVGESGEGGEGQVLDEGRGKVVMVMAAGPCLR